MGIKEISGGGGKMPNFVHRQVGFLPRFMDCAALQPQGWSWKLLKEYPPTEHCFKQCMCLSIMWRVVTWNEEGLADRLEFWKENKWKIMTNMSGGGGGWSKEWGWIYVIGMISNDTFICPGLIAVREYIHQNKKLNYAYSLLILNFYQKPPKKISS